MAQAAAPHQVAFDHVRDRALRARNALLPEAWAENGSVNVLAGGMMWHKRVRVKRNVMVQECPWLDTSLYSGTHVYLYDGPTYGVISAEGVAVTRAGQLPFFELPKDALEE